MSSSVSESIEPTVDGAFKNLATVARVQVMNSEYYDVSISGNPDMVGVANPDEKISAISGEKKASEFIANTWGYAASKNGAGVATAVVADSNTSYAPVPVTSTQIVNRQSTVNNAADDYYSLNFGAKVDTNIPADTYTSRVTLSVTASPVLATEYSLTYDGNGATGGTVPAKQTASSYDQSYEFVIAGNTGNLSKTGYTFLGWADSSSATVAQYVAGSKVTVAEADKDKTVYAVWKQNTNYSVTYSGNSNTGGAVPSQQTASNINASHEFTVPSDTPTRTGYIFLGWSKNSTATEATYTAGSKITLTSSDPTMTLHAVWRADVFNGITTMQSLTAAICKAAKEGDSVQLTDTRTNADTSSTNKYWVTKLKDGNCWMTQNLDYATSAQRLNAGTTQPTDAGKVWDVGLKVVVAFGESATDATGNYDAHYLVGNYYQQSAATNACSSIASQWNLPTASQATTVNGSYNKLLDGISPTQVIVDPYYFPPAGYIYSSNGSLLDAGSYSFHRSATSGRVFSFTSDTINPSYNGTSDIKNGFSVRCYVNGN